MQNPMKFVIVPDAAGGCHVRLVNARNHEIVFWTENYRNVRDARLAIAKAKRNVAHAPVQDLYSAFVRRLRRAS